LALLAAVLAGCSLQQDVASHPESGPKVGAPAPEVRGTTLSGGSFDLAAERGHPVVIDVYGSWCAPCRAQQPQLNQVAARYQPRGVAMVGIGFRDGTAQLRSYDADNHVPYPTVEDDSGDVAAGLAVLSPPTTVVVDAAGRVAATYFGGVEASALGGVLDRLLGGSGG
jgi:thiol-disulfide isomerase/thioredoxin